VRKERYVGDVAAGRERHPSGLCDGRVAAALECDDFHFHRRRNAGDERIELFRSANQPDRVESAERGEPGDDLAGVAADAGAPECPRVHGEHGARRLAHAFHGNETTAMCRIRS
jgi:hypothetical protein